MPPDPDAVVSVEVRLFANLADHLPAASRGRSARVAVPDGTTVEELCRRLDLPADQPCLTLVNGRDVPATHRLAAGDVVAVIPPLAGGRA